MVCFRLALFNAGFAPRLSSPVQGVYAQIFSVALMVPQTPTIPSFKVRAWMAFPTEAFIYHWRRRWPLRRINRNPQSF